MLRASFRRRSVGRFVESLERRQLLCGLHGPEETMKPVELRPDLVGVHTRVADPADIVWVNRGQASDQFDARFGTSAPLARAVVDAVIVAFERMLGSFNYSLAGQTYSLTLSMGASGGGFGASAGISTTLGGVPKSGSVTMGAGNGSANANDDNGWFLDPTPFDSAEFMGNITNAFTGDAQAGSPASGKGDFYTVVAAEMTHCLGMSSFNPPGWAPRVTDTGIPDTAEGGGVGTFYVFQGPSIKHLLTSNNGGPNGSARATAVHSAGPNVPVVYNGETYYGGQDHGNAVYEFGRRYTVNKVFSLMYKDAFGYSTVDPSKWGTFYSVLNETSKLLTVRGGDFASGQSNSDDIISITRTGNTIFVSVDAGKDVRGSGELPGEGDLPAWVSEYDISQISSIALDAGAGNDTITIGTNIGVPISIIGGSGTDSITYVGSDSGETISLTTTAMTSGSTSVSVTSGIEAVAVDGGAGTDTINVTESTGPITVINSAGNDLVNVNTDNTGAATVQFNTTMILGSLNVGNGGTANLLSGGSRVLVTGTLAITGTGKLDLFDNDLILDYSGASQLSAAQALINSARAGGGWTGNGLTSTSARTSNPANKTLGAMEASDYKSIYGPAAQFAGQTIDDTAVLVKFTYYGDTDFNGVVNFDDYARIDAGFSQGRTGWLNGDFDGNGVVNFDDYSLMDLAFNTQGVVLRPGALPGSKPTLGLPRVDGRRV